MTVDRSVRLSQTVVPFGVGAIFDYRGESLVACDVSFWKGRGQIVDLPRLAAALGVDHLKSAPSITGFQTPGWRVPYMRFPGWLFCGTCRRMTRWRPEDEIVDEQPRCDRCRRRPQLVPMRFVIACEDGHLGDVDWPWWAHSRAKTPDQKQCRLRQLDLVTRGGGIGLETLLVRCRNPECRAGRSLQGITSAEVTKAAGMTCPGRQPWQRIGEAVDCDKDARVVQRGASNLYFARVESALDIPPHSAYDPYAEEVLAIASKPEFQVILSAPSGPIAQQLLGVLAEEHDMPIERVEAIVEAEIAERDGRPPATPTETGDLQADEWHALLGPADEHDHRDRFITRDTPLLDTDPPPTPVERGLGRRLDRVVLATRLREVRALAGFTRYKPDAKVVLPDLGRGIDFLPAVEVYGEGIFVTFDEESVAAWERDPTVLERVEALEERRRSSFLGVRLPVVSPRFVLVHTFAHLLVRRLAFEAGYPAASLRERIYAVPPDRPGGPQAGALIYTAAGDLEGTLGGLVRMGEYPHLIRSVLATLEQASWCSADPICAESPGQGFAAMNLAACHACSLLAETSCAHTNLLLDRLLLVGSARFRSGYFVDDIAAALAAAAQEVDS